MRTTQVLRALGPIDAKSIARDPLIRWLAAIPLAFGLAVRWLLPALTSRLSAVFELDLTPWLGPLIGAYLLTMAPMLAGWVVGFLLLDQRDDGTLAALQVTPLSLTGYMAYRLSVPTAWAVLLTIVVMPLSGLWSQGLAPLVLAALAAAPLAPVCSLYLACFAANKVQGFALLKASGVLAVPPMVAYFVPRPWQLALGLVPTCWSPFVFWQAAAGEPLYWVNAVVGLVYGSLFVAVLVRRFNRVTRR